MDESPLRLLLVEDNPADARLLQMLLAEARAASRYQWTVAARLSEAVAQLAAGAWDAVLLDLSLPDSQGLETLARLRAAADRVPIIVQTGLNDEDLALAALRAGAQDYLVKGQITGDLLARTLRYAISRQQADQALRDNQARLAGLIDTAMDAVITVDASERITVFNQAAEHTFGYPAAAMLGQPLSRLLPGDFREAHHGQMRHFAASGITARAKGTLPTLRGLRADGTQFPIEASISHVAVGGQALFTVILRDISQRRAMEQALADSNAELRALFAAMTEVILVLDGDGRYVQIAPTNPPALYRLTPDMLGRRLHDYFPPEQADQFVASIRQALASQQTVPLDYQLEIGGQTVWFAATLSPMGPDRVFLIVRDITASKVAEAALRESETHLRTLFESAPISLWEEDFSAVKDYLDRLPAGPPETLDAYLSAHPEAVTACVPLVTVLDVNAATVALTEVPDKASLLGGLVVSLTPESRAVFQQELVAIRAGQRRLRAEASLLTYTGRQRTVTLDWAVAPGHEARYTRVLLSLVDITERKLAEIALHQSEEQYRLLFERNPMPMFVYDPDSLRIVDVNSVAIAHYGYTRKEWLALLVTDLGVPEELPELRATLAAGPGDDRARTWRHRKQDGALMDVEITSHPIEVGGHATRLVLANDVTERRQAEAQVQRQLNRMAALRAIDLAISASLDLRLTLQMVLDQVCHLLSLDAAGVYLLNSATRLVTFAAGRGFPSGLRPPESLRLGQALAGRVALERHRLLLTDLGHAVPGAARHALFESGGFQAYVGLPLEAKGQVVGVLEVYQRASLPEEPDWLGFLEAVAGQAAIAIDNATLFDGLQLSNQNLSLAYDATIEGWSRALDLRDRETAGHSQRLADLTLQLASGLGLDGEALENLRLGVLLHDIGKMGIPDSILLKPGPLTPDEWTVMRQHPMIAYDLLLPIRHLSQALEVPYGHHEKWDGSGYPRGLAGESIPLAARIFAVVDVWDSLRSERTYRRPWPAAQARAYLHEQSGRHFDPFVLAAFEHLLDQED